MAGDTINRFDKKMKKLIHYRLGVNRQFPATHLRKGEETKFIEKMKFILNCTICPFVKSAKDCLKFDCTVYKGVGIKRNTIRANYFLWAKRFEKIDRGEAVLELFYWSGKPYNSKQVVFATLTKDDGIGIQRLDFGRENIMYPLVGMSIFVMPGDIANNDGLSFGDWKAWFRNYDLSKPLAIIHFTKFRY